MKPDEYRKMAEVEDRMWYYRALHAHVVRSLKQHSSRSAASVLDAGCGTGGLLRALAAHDPAGKRTGLDFSALACELARFRSDAEVVEGSVAELPFPAANFEAIVSCDVLCQVPDPARVLVEFYRCLRPGGVIILTMPAYQWMFSYHDRAVANLRRYSRREVSVLCREAGFTVVQATYWNMLPFPLAVLRRKVLPPTEPASDVRPFPAPVETVFNGLMALERGWLSAGGRLPFGSSVLTVARKPSETDLIRPQ